MNVYEIWDITEKQEERTETTKMNFLRCAAGYTRKAQIRNTNSRKELSIFNLNN
jgi:hypothetical protein